MIVVDTGGAPQYYKFLYATQSPQYASFSKLDLVEYLHPPCRITGKNWSDVTAGVFKLHFTVDFGSPTSWTALAALQADSLSVLPHMFHVHGDRVGVDGDPVPWRRFVADLPGLVPPAAAQSSGGSAAPKQTPSDAPAWLTSFSESQSRRPCHTQPLANDTQEDTDRSLPLDDDALNDILNELHQAREAWALKDDVRTEDFRVAILGGAWTKKNLRVSIDAYKGMSRTSEADAWYRRLGLKLSARYDVSVYGAALASTLASAWCHRVQYYFSVSKKCGTERFSDEDHEAYKEPATLAALSDHAHGQLQGRLVQLRAIRP